MLSLRDAMDVVLRRLSFRQVYGMEHREQWCTQCKWKKACTRFSME